MREGKEITPNKQLRLMTSKQEAFVRDFIDHERLPESYSETVKRFFATLAQRLCAVIRQSKHVPVIGINGAQGTGKSTCSACLAGLLGQQGLRVLVLSIDDLYLPKAKRQRLAAEVHPLLATRGVPGTHDMELFREIVALARGEASRADLCIPRFDKGQDDQCPKGTAFPREGVDAILFEGWCVGAVPEPVERLDDACNDLERECDPDGRWRRYVNQQLGDVYAKAFALLDYWVMLKAPGFEVVYEWRGEQERKLRDRLSEQGKPASEAMNEAELARFISHYERLTRWMLSEMPSRAHEVFFLGEDHDVCSYMRHAGTPLRYLISTDLDATLLDDEYRWDAAMPALKQLAGLRACVVLNSSKTVSEMKELAHTLRSETGLPPAPLVAENGGVLAIPDEKGYRIECLGRSRDEILELAHGLRDKHEYAFRGFADMTPEEVVELTGLSRDAAVMAMDRQATEPILWHDTEERWTSFSSALEHAGILAVRGGRFVHLMGPTDKADGMTAALAWCQGQAPASLWRVVALGDSPNDLAMLNAADVAVAIGNPSHGQTLTPTAMQCMVPSGYGPAAWNAAIKAIISNDE